MKISIGTNIKEGPWGGGNLFAKNLKNFLIESIKEFELKTFSQKAKKILNNFDAELKNFKQVCPIEMLDKLDNPITLKPHIKKAG